MSRLVMLRRLIARALAVCGCVLISAGAARAEVTVTLRLDLRPAMAEGVFDPARDTVGLRGATAPLSWQHTLLAEPWVGPGVEPGFWRVTLRFAAAPAQPVAYKIKLERAGRPDLGWEPGRHVAPREVQVWLPPGYAEAPQRRYPVLHLHDGQNVFDAMAAGAEWQVDEHADALVRQGAIEPLIDARFRTRPGRADTSVARAGCLTHWPPAAGPPPTWRCQAPATTRPHGRRGCPPCCGIFTRGRQTCRRTRRKTWRRRHRHEPRWTLFLRTPSEGPMRALRAQGPAPSPQPAPP